jgi:lipoprotein-anchoring transpeptidase ErfK/SrfK
VWFTNPLQFHPHIQHMRREWIPTAPYLLLALLSAGSARAQTYYPQPMAYPPPARPAMRPVTPPLIVVAQPPQMRTEMGGGFIEYLFGDDQRPVSVVPYVVPAPQPGLQPPRPAPVYVNTGPVDPMLEQRRPDLPMDPQFLPQEVAYDGSEAPGTVVVDTPHHFLYLVEDGGKARRYGIGVARPGFTWSGEHTISAKKEWPAWVPPEEMLQRQPYLPHFMPGGPNNPLGARALYLGSTLYRIHGSNEPWTIGHNVSSGCIRMRNVDVIDLYDRVKLGTKVVVM